MSSLVGGLVLDFVLGERRDGALRPETVKHEREDQAEGSADDAANQREESEDLQLGELPRRRERERENHRDDDSQNDADNKEAQKTRAATNNDLLL